MAPAIRGVNNINKYIYLSNYSLIIQIIIINLLTVFLGLIFLFIFNFWSLSNNENLDKQYESINNDLIEINNYLQKYALINIPEFESCEISKQNQIILSKKCIERKEGGLQLIISTSLFLDPIITQNHISNNYLNKPHNIKIYDDTLIKFADTSNMPISIEVTEVYVDKPEMKENVYLRYKNFYFKAFKDIQTYIIQKKLESQKKIKKYIGDISLVRETIMKKENLFYTFKNENGNFTRINSSPIIGEDVIYGVVLVSSTLDKQNEEAAIRSFYLTNFFIFIIFFMFIFSILFTRSIISPIKKLSKVVRSERDKSKNNKYNLEYPIRQDEIGILSREVQDMSQDLNKRIKEVENFVQDVSHELKNPLASLKSSNEILVDNKIENNKKNLLLKNMKKDIDRINVLIDEISKYAIVDIETEIELFSKFDLVNFLNEFLELYRENKKNIKINFEFLKKPCLIYANKEKLARVFDNLLINSFSLCPENSKILIKQEISKDNVVIYFVDQGDGIEDNVRNKIFERFYTDRIIAKERHSGLGLSIAKKIIESFSGSIKISDIKFQQYLGACFEIKLPLKD